MNNQVVLITGGLTGIGQLLSRLPMKALSLSFRAGVTKKAKSWSVKSAK